MSDDVRPEQPRPAGSTGAPHPPRSFWARPLPGETVGDPVDAPMVGPVETAVVGPVDAPEAGPGETPVVPLSGPGNGVVGPVPDDATVPGPGGASPFEPAGVPSESTPRGRAVVRQAGAGLLGVTAATLVTGVMTVLLVAGMALHPGLRQAVASVAGQLGPVDPTAGARGLVSTTVQLVAMALGGRLHGAVSVFTVSIAAWLALPVVSVLAALLGASHGAARLAGPRVARRRDAVPGAVAAGLASSLVVLALARLAGFGSPAAPVHAAGPRVLLVGWPLLALASFTGTVARSRLRLFDGHPLAREAGRALGVLTAFVAVFAALTAIGGGAVLLVGSLVHDGFAAAVGLLLALPVFAGTLVAALLALASGASVQASTGAGGGTAHLGSSTVSLATLPPVLAVVTLVALLAALAVAAARWSTRRRVLAASSRARVASWALLPATFALAGWALLGNAVAVGARTGTAGSTAVHYGPTAWTPVGMLLVGLAVELVARLAGERLASVLPGLVVGAPVPSTGPEAVGSGSATGSSGPGGMLDGSVAAATSGATAVVRRSRHHLVLGLVAALLVALLVAGLAVVRQVQATSESPRARAAAVMDALVAADVDRMQELVPSSRHMGPLVSTDAYRAATGRPSAYRITEVRTAGDRATVSTVVTMAGQDVPLDLDVHRTGRRLGVLDTWQVARLPLADVVLGVPAGTSAVVANGTTVPVMAGPSSAGGQAVSMPALPGTYSFSLPRLSPLLEPLVVQRQVLPMAVPSRDQLGHRPTEALVARVDAAVRQQLDACARVSGSAPAGCPWRVTVTGGTAHSTVTWAVVSRPGWQLAATSDPTLWHLATTRPGLVRAALRPAPGAPVTDTATVGYTVDGTVTVSGDDVTVRLR